jgi:hypothetical protein
VASASQTALRFQNQITPRLNNWRERYGKVNEHNGWVPRGFLAGGLGEAGHCRVPFEEPAGRLATGRALPRGAESQLPVKPTIQERAVEAQISG